MDLGGNFNSLMQGYIAHQNLYNLLEKFIRRERLLVNVEQLPILWCICRHGVLCQQEIANIVVRDKSSVKRAVISLQCKGIISIQQDKNDRRKNLLTLTALGKAVAGKLALFRYELV